MNISLTGMPGSGKTTIGKLLALALKEFSYIDTDEEIEKKEDKTINDIFAFYKEPYFRKIETQVLNEILNTDNNIISTGGGIIKSEDNIRILKEKSIVIYLKTDEETLFERVKNNKERPLLNVDDLKNKIKILMSERSKYYEQSHIIIDTDHKKPDIIVSEIIEKINTYGKN